MPDTLRAVVYASQLPFSLIIVGVGSADFGAMAALVGEQGAALRDDRGNTAVRDIVLFVPFRDYELVRTFHFLGGFESVNHV